MPFLRSRILRTEEWSQASTPAQALLHSVSTASPRRASSNPRMRPAGPIRTGTPLPRPRTGWWRPYHQVQRHATAADDESLLDTTDGLQFSAYGSSNLSLPVTSIQSASLPAGVPRRRADVRATPLIRS